MSGIHIGPGEGERDPARSALPPGPRRAPRARGHRRPLRPGIQRSLHTHPDHVDSFYVLEGEAEFTLGDEVVRAVAGTWVTAPIGIVHGFRNTGDGELRVLNIHAPNTGFADRLRANS